MFFTHRSYIPPVIIVLAVIALYAGFLNNPLQFDDFYFFMPGVPEHFLDTLGLRTRHLAHATLLLSWKWFGTALISFRIASLFLHAAVALALYFFLCELQQVLSTGHASKNSSLLPLFAALIFALHPAAVYGAAYLIQRTIVMATLFSLLSWTFFLHGLRTNKKYFLWASIGMYGLAVLSKEHAIMMPAVSAILAVWFWRTRRIKLNVAKIAKNLIPVFVCYFFIALWVVLQPRETFGSAYELDAAEMLRLLSIKDAWLFSAVTQGALFFKYIFIWLMPNPLAMSVDMREPFAYSLTAWPYALGFSVFIIWPLVSGWLLWKGGRRGLLGFSMLAPWLLFATELTTVRIQEIFVLYRSYYWFAPVFCIVLVIEPLVKLRTLMILTGIVPLLLFPLGWDRLRTFSSPLLLWDDAERLLDGRHGLTGLARIYYNRGMAWHNLKKFDFAIPDYSSAINAKPNFSNAYTNRGLAMFELKRYQEALNDLDISLRIKPDDAFTLTGRGVVLEAMGKSLDAKNTYLSACSLGSQVACDKMKNAQ